MLGIKTKERLAFIPVSSSYAGRAVRASTWVELGEMVNTLISRGSQLVPGQFLHVDDLTSGSITFRVPRNNVTTQIDWGIFAKARGAFRVSGSDWRVQHASAQRLKSNSTVYRYWQHLTEKTGSEESISLHIKRGKLQPNVDIIGLSCNELRRVNIGTGSNSGEYGIDVAELRPIGPMWASSSAPNYAGAWEIAGALERTGSLGRRVGLFMWGVPDEASSARLSTTSTLYKPMFAHAVPIFARPMMLDTSTLAAETTASVGIRIRGNGGGQPSFVQVSSSVEIIEISVTGSSDQWFPSIAEDPAFLSVRVDDMSQPDGFSDWGDYEVEFNFKTGGGGEIDISRVCVFEPNHD